jgi:hypothetical protein
VILFDRLLFFLSVFFLFSNHSSSFLDWNILSGEQVKSVAALAPTTVEELSSEGVMGEQKIKEYGPRLVKAVNNYIQNHNLQEYIAKRPLKRPKSSESATGSAPVANKGRPAAQAKPTSSNNPIILDDEDEFGADIDFSDFENLP